MRYVHAVAYGVNVYSEGDSWKKHNEGGSSGTKSGILSLSIIFDAECC